MIDGNRKLTVEFKMNTDNGFCYTPCPYNKECFVYSVRCQDCEHFFGLIPDTNIIKCTGARIEEQES